MVPGWVMDDPDRNDLIVAVAMVLGLALLGWLWSWSSKGGS